MREKTEGLSGRVGELERELTIQTTEAEVLNRRVQDLESRLNEQSKVLAERDYKSARNCAAPRRMPSASNPICAEIVTLEQRYNGTSSSLRAEKAVLEKELEHTREERRRHAGDRPRGRRERQLRERGSRLGGSCATISPDRALH